MEVGCKFTPYDQLLPEHVFGLVACSYCYIYLFDTSKPEYSLQLNRRNPMTLEAKNGSHYPMGTIFASDFKNATVASKICSSLSENDCTRWTTCCENALKCCKRQLTVPRWITNATYCSRTWDGWGCLDDTAAGGTAFIQCPSYVEHAKLESKAYRPCWENGTWFIHPVTRKEWTNYTTCVELSDHMTLVYVGLACNLLSLILLIPSCGIFLAFRQLRSQQRIRLHLCFFFSFILSALVTILWDFLVHHDRLVNSGDSGKSRLESNSGDCKFLYILLRYCQTANFFWMFCEGFYLHRLIVHAFEVPKNLIWYYIIGFGFDLLFWLALITVPIKAIHIGVPWIPLLIYAIIRATNSQYDVSCWVHHAYGYEWIVYTPNLLCLFANVFFLGNILRILLTQLQSHPNEPSGYRRALKATFVLIPLFGIQWSLVLYRVQQAVWYEIMRTVVQNTQGAIVSLIFCIFNGEVHSHLKNFIQHHWPSSSPGGTRPDFSTVSATQYTHIHSRSSTAQDFQEGIPLSHHQDAYVEKEANGHATESGSLLL